MFYPRGLKGRARGWHSAHTISRKTKAHNREGKESVRKRIAKKHATTLNLGSQAANTEKGATTRKNEKNDGTTRHHDLL
jgi:hypothetical protein